MNRLVDALDARGPHVLHDVAAEDRGTAFAQPFHARSVQSRGRAVEIERAFLAHPHPPSGSYQDGIARLHAETRLFLPGFEVFDINRLVVVQIGDALPLRHVERTPRVKIPFFMDITSFLPAPRSE